MPDEPIKAPVQTPTTPPAATPATTPERPSWLPEGFDKPEALATSYQDLNRRFSEAEPKLKAAEKWARWGDPDQFEANLARNIAEREKQLKTQWERERTAPSTEKDPFEGYELMDPRQQAQVMASHLQTQMAQALQSEIAKLTQGVDGKLGETDQRFNLLARALQAKAATPDLNVDNLWGEARKLATGDANELFNLALERATAESRQQKMIADAVAAEKVKWDQERQNADNAALTGPGSPATASSFRDMLAARNGKDANSIHQRVVQKGIKEGWLRPGRL